MDLQAGPTSEEGVRLRVPLNLNHNDKGTGFGGSLATLCTLAGWCVVSEICARNDCTVDIVVVTSRAEYIKPVTDEYLSALGLWPDTAEEAEFLRTLQKDKWAKMRVRSRTGNAESPAVVFEATFGAKVL